MNETRSRGYLEGQSDAPHTMRGATRWMITAYRSMRPDVHHVEAVQALSGSACGNNRLRSKLNAALRQLPVGAAGNGRSVAHQHRYIAFQKHFLGFAAQQQPGHATAPM